MHISANFNKTFTNYVFWLHIALPLIRRFRVAKFTLFTKKFKKYFHHSYKVATREVKIGHFFKKIYFWGKKIKPSITLSVIKDFNKYYLILNSQNIITRGGDKITKKFSYSQRHRTSQKLLQVQTRY